MFRRRCIYKKILYLTFDLGVKVTQNGHTKCCPVPSTSCDLFSYKVCSCYVYLFRRRYIYKKMHYFTFGLDLGAKVTQNVAQYPLHHVTYSPTKFEVATSNGLGGDTFTRNVTDGRIHARTDRRTDDRLTLTRNYTFFFLKTKAGIIKSRMEKRGSKYFAARPLQP